MARIGSIPHNLDVAAGQAIRRNAGDTAFEAYGYKVYTALITQFGTNAPVATVLENTLSGTPVWTRTGVGVYPITLTGAFPNDNKLFILPSRAGVLIVADVVFYFIAEYTSANVITLHFYDTGFIPMDLENNVFFCFEIRVYP